MVKNSESIRKEIEAIKEKVIKEHLGEVSEKKWTSTTFYRALANNLDKNRNEFEEIVKNLYSEMSNYMKNAKFSESSIRGKLRGFRAISKKTIDALKYDKTKKLEVALQRVLAAANTNFTCEFSTLSGVHEKQYKRGIDLVKEQKDGKKGYLIELKGWTWEAGHPFYAAIEIIIYFFAFLLVRKRVKNEFPEWNEFELIVMAPEDYFNYDKKNISEETHIKIFKYLNKGLQKLKLKDEKELNCVKYNLNNKYKLKITQDELKEIVKNNKNKLLNDGNNNRVLNEPIINASKLTLKLF